jgi:hypothetical protein
MAWIEISKREIELVTRSMVTVVVNCHRKIADCPDCRKLNLLAEKLAAAA